MHEDKMYDVNKNYEMDFSIHKNIYIFKKSFLSFIDIDFIFAYLRILVWRKGVHRLFPDALGMM